MSRADVNSARPKLESKCPKHLTSATLGLTSSSSRHLNRTESLYGLSSSCLVLDKLEHAGPTFALQNRVGSKFGGGGVAGASESNVDRRERLRKLALETIDLAKASYVYDVPYCCLTACRTLIFFATIWDP
jgi:hypothetical protein